MKYLSISHNTKYSLSIFWESENWSSLYHIILQSHNWLIVHSLTITTESCHQVQQWLGPLTNYFFMSQSVTKTSTLQQTSSCRRLPLTHKEGLLWWFLPYTHLILAAAVNRQLYLSTKRELFLRRSCSATLPSHHFGCLLYRISVRPWKLPVNSNDCSLAQLVLSGLICSKVILLSLFLILFLVCDQSPPIPPKFFLSISVHLSFSSLSTMSMLSIPSYKTDDPNYRYKMPRLVAKVEGRGNGIRTSIVNMGDIARALKRPPDCKICFSLIFYLSSLHYALYHSSHYFCSIIILYCTFMS